MVRVCVLVLLLLLNAVIVQAEDFEIKVIRVGADLYQVPEDDLSIKTHNCFVMKDPDILVLHLAAEGNTLIFPPKNFSCDISMIYGRSTLAPANYSFTVTRLGDNWYEVDGKDVALKTSACEVEAEQFPATLRMETRETGALLFPELDTFCAVEGIYAETELTVVTRQDQQEEHDQQAQHEQQEEQDPQQ